MSPDTELAILFDEQGIETVSAELLDSAGQSL